MGRRRKRRARGHLGARVGLATLVVVSSGIVADRLYGDIELPRLSWPSGGWSRLPWPDVPGFDAPAPSHAPNPPEGDRLQVASFNVKFVGYYPERDDDALASLLAPYDIVLIQEIVAPPYPGRFPDGEPYRPDPESTAFFDAMRTRGFAFVLASEDTGPGEKSQDNSAATEWFAAFYRPQRVSPAKDLPRGYLSTDRTANPAFDRVPHAFSFRTRDGGPDFVLVSVHLHAARSGWKRRRDELATIARWIDAHDQVERDFIIIGDMNVQNCRELERVTPPGFASLNHTCRSTNTVGTHRSTKGRPYDHVMLRPEYASEIDIDHGMQVIDLVDAMRSRWRGPGPYPGAPYRHSEFISRYSDHHPITFAIRLDVPDDDGQETVFTNGRATSSR